MSIGQSGTVEKIIPTKKGGKKQQPGNTMSPGCSIF
jgi:hypothetical protein